MSNYPLSYKLSWLPRFLKPSLAGDARGFAAPSGTWMRPPPVHSVRLAIVGDISAIANRAAPACDPVLSALLRSADLVIGNCESPIVAKPKARLGTALGTHHAMTEPFISDTISAAGIAREKLVLSLANNHVLDQGVEGFDETLAALDRLGIRTIGLRRQGAVVPIEVAGDNARDGEALRIGFAAFTRWRNAGEEAFASRISMEGDPAGWSAESAKDVDLVCAVPHWDWEFRHFPRAETQAMARRLVVHGVGLVVGGHAHVVQPVERIGDTLVAYGLGDFLGTAFARQPWPGRIGAILVVDVSVDAATRGAIAAYRMHFFFRLREGNRERLVPVEALEGEKGGKVGGRLARIYGDHQDH